MNRESVTDEDWVWTVDRLGGEERVTSLALHCGAFKRAREIGSAIDLLRITLAYCLGHMGLRTTAAWAEAVGLASLSNVALLHRLRKTGKWLSCLIGQLLKASCPNAAKGRVIRILDGTSVAQAGPGSRRDNRLWRIHASFELPSERFDFLELTDERGGERLDRVPVIHGEIRIGDAAYMQVDQIGEVMRQGADVLVRANWRNARWFDQQARPLDLLALLGNATGSGAVDQLVLLSGRKGKPLLPMRLIALRKPEAARAEARRKARRNAQREGRTVSEEALFASEWVILVTSLAQEVFAMEDILKLYRMRWRIELAFKRLKSLTGLRSPPAKDPRLAKPWILSHLLMILLVEPLTDEFGVSLS
jgi:hypothetical protein